MLALDAVHRYGLIFPHHVLQERTYSALTTALELGNSVDSVQVANKARSVLAHLSPKLDIGQVAEFVRTEGADYAGASRESDPFAELVLSSPRQRLIQQSFTFSMLDELEATFGTASVIFKTLVEKLSDPSLHKDLPLPLLLEGANYSALALGLLVPELVAKTSDLPEWVAIHVASLVDSLSWIIQAGGPLREDSPERLYKSFSPLGRAEYWDEQASDRTIVWVLLTLLLNRDLPWSDSYETERKTLCILAKQTLEQDERQYRSKPGRIALQLFLAAANTEAVPDHDLVQDVSARTASFLSQYYAGRATTPYYADGLTAAVAAWLAVAPGGALRLPHSREFCNLAREALDSRARNLNLQAFMFRVAEVNSE